MLFSLFRIYLPLDVRLCRELIDCRRKKKREEKSFTFHYRPVWRLIKIHSSFVPLIFALLIIFLSINFFPSLLRFFFYTRKLYIVFQRPSLLIYCEKRAKKYLSQHFLSILLTFFNFPVYYCRNKMIRQLITTPFISYIIRLTSVRKHIRIISTTWITFFFFIKILFVYVYSKLELFKFNERFLFIKTVDNIKNDYA